MSKHLSLLFLAVLSYTVSFAAGGYVTCNPTSGTLPVMYIFTENNAEITSKEVYLNASYYLDANGVGGYESIGSADAMLTTKIKGRGNYSWNGFDKKPYRLKLDKKAALMGMKSSKHFGLLAHADDKQGFLRNTLGFECSRLFGLDYTPAQEPLELVVNGQYRGLYFLTELIRIDKDRVNITEQEEEDTDPYNATGGWLLEIDNYDEDPSIQFRMIEKGDDLLKVTSKSPEVMSDVQYNYMYNYLYNTNKAIQDGGDWEKYIDIESLVNLYLVYEVMGNHEGFHGSCYMHKDRGDDTKLVFGPAWDFGSSLGWQGHIYERPLWGDTWIDDLAQFPQFQAKAGERWQAVRPILYSHLKDLADSFIAQISSAAKCDCQKWPTYGNRDVEQKKADVLGYLRSRMLWLDTFWGTTDAAENGLESEVPVYPNPTHGYISVPSDTDVVSACVSDINGRIVQTLDNSERTWMLNVENGIYIVSITTADGVNHTSKVVKY